VNLEIALDKAISYEDFDIVELLLSNNVDVNTPLICNETPIQYAASKGNYELVKLLHEYGENINAINQDGNTALLNAVKCGGFSVVDYLIEHNANIHTKGKNGMKVIDYCYNLDVINSLSDSTIKKLFKEFGKLDYPNQGRIEMRKCILFALLKTYRSEISMCEADYKPTIFTISIPVNFVPDMLLGVSKKEKVDAVDALIKAILENNSYDEVYQFHEKALSSGELGKIYDALKYVEIDSSYNSNMSKNL
jgi:hypothetical protein